MPHVLKMKDGKLLTPFGIRDLLDAVQDYAGEELRREIESYIDTNVEDIDDYEKEYDRMEQDNERLADHQRSVSSAISGTRWMLWIHSCRIPG